MDELLREFLAEAEDLIEALFRDTAALREKQAEGRARRELTGRIFRHVHTLKGTAASAGLDVASRIAHEFETLLDAIRHGSLNVNEPLLDAFEDATHALAQALDTTARGALPTLPLQLIESLRRFTQADDDRQHTSRQPSQTNTDALLPEELARSLGAEETRRVQEAAAEGQSLFVIHTTFDLETFDGSFRALTEQLSQTGELISTLPGLLEAAPGAISLRLLYASSASVAELAALTQTFGSVSLEELKPAKASAVETADELDEDAHTPRAVAEGVAPLPTQVRVELGQLDALINATHELMAETSAVLELALETRAGTGESSGVEQRASLIHQRFIELEEQLIGLRRVPLARTLERAARAGRQAARATGKRVEFQITGGDIRLDKSLVEAINDPLLHLVRNAVDHGVEPEERRERAGKSGAGIVRLEAVEDADRVGFGIAEDHEALRPRVDLQRGVFDRHRLDRIA
jgi:two-component system chemotaxis sensor kinase CheA